jgi:cephalosporin hydroxylase
MSTSISSKYFKHCINYSDIYEHLPTLKKYAEECSHITECGVRTCVSSYAFAEGLKKSKEKGKMIQYDIGLSNEMMVFSEDCRREKINLVTRIESDTTCPREQTDLLFIDTWHVYPHLKTELEYWNTYVNKYIIMHDTTVDEFSSEIYRMDGDTEKHLEKFSKESGHSTEDLKKGLWPAIEEFLRNHSDEWELHKRFFNNNGLTILKKKNRAAAKSDVHSGC